MAKRSLAQLIVSLGIDSAAYKSGLQKSRTDTETWSRKVRQTATQARATMNKSVAVFGAAAAATTAATAVMVKQNMQVIDQLAKYSDRLGVTTQALAGLRHQAQLSGVANSELDKALQNMVVRIGEVENGTGAAADSLAKLGLNADDLKRLAPDEQFRRVADAMSQVENATDRVSIAYEIFGGRGAGVLNMMNDGAAGLMAAQKEAEGLGIAISRIDAAKVEAANDAAYRASLGFEGLKNTITVAVAPVIAGLADDFFNAAKESNGFKDQVANAMEVAAKVVGHVANTVHGLKVVWKGAQVVAAEVLNFYVQVFSKISSMLPEISESVPLIGQYAEQINGFKKSTALFAEASVDRTKQLRQELAEMAAQDLPSEKVDAWFENVKSKAQQAAEEIARQRSQKAEPGEETPDDPDGIAAKIESELAVQEFFTDAYERRQQMLDTALEKKQITEQRHQEISKRNWQKYMQETANFEAENRQMMIQSTQGFFANMATLSEHGNKNLSRIGKAAAAVNIVIGTIEAAQNAYKVASQWGGPIAGAAAATAASVAGMMRLRALQSVGSGGSASISSGGLSGQTTFDQNLPTAGGTGNMSDTTYTGSSAGGSTAGGASGGVVVNITNNSSVPVNGTATLKRDTDGRDVIDVMLEDIDYDGPITNRLQQKYDLKRRA